MAFPKKIKGLGTLRILRERMKNAGLAYCLLHVFLSFSRKVLKITAQECYSQLGEDITLRHIFLDKVFRSKETGFFVDVGCNHPTDGNNCYFFYARGWRGINLDGNAELIKKFHKQRPRDISLCLLVSDQEKEVDFFLMEADKLSSMDAPAIEQSDQDFAKSKKIVLRTRSLTSILDEYLDKNQKIDFLNVDAEGHDLQVLKSLDFARYTPEIIVVEIGVANIEQAQKHPITDYLHSVGYAMIYFSIISAFFEHKSRQSQA